jgi:hypothetical protein
MDRLNYFNPYDSKAGSHEDQLTRAYLVLLKHSSHALFTFVDYARCNQQTSGDEQPISIVELLDQDWDFETQKGNPVIDTNFLLSVLITDEQLKTDDSNVKPSERNARYDGVITFGKSLTIIIENKPRSSNVWPDQLNPSRQNLADDKTTTVYRHPIVLEWKEIIKQLNHLLHLPTISGCEKIMIEDFRSFVNDNFPFLNPFDSLHQCKRIPEFLDQRINNLLKSLLQDERDESKIGYHRGGGYFIQTPYPQIGRICLSHNEQENDLVLTLGLYFGDTQRAAIAFYKSDPNISHLQGTKWDAAPNFHVAYRSSGLMGFESENSEHYLQFWKDNVDKIRQQKRAEVPKFLKSLADQKVLSMTKEAGEKLEEKFYNTKMPSLNICPGFRLHFPIPNAEALDKDGKDGKLKFILAEKIREGLKIIGLNGDDFLKKL